MKLKVEKAALESFILSPWLTKQLYTTAVASKQVNPAHNHTDV
jgi:hypothetical protein